MEGLGEVLGIPFSNRSLSLPGNVTLTQIPQGCRAREGKTNNVPETSHLQDLTNMNSTRKQMWCYAPMWKQYGDFTCAQCTVHTLSPNLGRLQFGQKRKFVLLVNPGSTLGTLSNPELFSL